MRVASKIVVLVRDPAGYSAAIAGALQPETGSQLKREESSFELPLGKYGLDSKASGELVQFVDLQGSPQVSIFVIPEYAPPIAACAVSEILQLISSENQSASPVLIIPLVKRLSASYHGVEHKATTAGHSPVLYGVEIGGATDLTHALLDGTTAPPQGLQIRSEPIACLLQMALVLKVPSVLLTASGGRHGSSTSTNRDLEVLSYLGNHLAGHINLGFSKESLQEKSLQQQSQVVQEPWRELYG